MTALPQHLTPVSTCNRRARAFAGWLICVLTIVVLQPAQAQSFRILHAFSNGGDGGTPTAGVTLDAVGNIYGTASTGGAGQGGTVFHLKRAGDAWTLNTLHTFQPNNGDGEQPLGGLVFGPDGTLFGTTFGGGTGCLGGCGTVYNLRPPRSFCRTVNCEWTATILHSFRGYPSDGGQPEYVDLIFDHAGNLYGTTCGGGGVNYGTVFEVTPSNGSWTEAPIHTFGGDGECPQSGVLLDAAGNLYGTTLQGPGNQGEVYELSPSGSGWTVNVLERFEGINGNAPTAGLVADRSGNLYGMTLSGTVFELSYSGGVWNFTVIYTLSGGGGYGALVMDAAGNLYGTQFVGGTYGVGAVFKLTSNNGNWTYTDLHDFVIASGGAFPQGSVALDADGNLYGTASQGGILSHGCGYWGCGSVWEITP